MLLWSCSWCWEGATCPLVLRHGVRSERGSGGRSGEAPDAQGREQALFRRHHHCVSGDFVVIDWGPDSGGGWGTGSLAENRSDHREVQEGS